MNWKAWFLSCCLLTALGAGAQASAPKETSQSDTNTQGVAVPEQVAALLRPILDEKEKGAQH
ncbi:MAG TPA: hypothetical protein VKF84_08650, partial [Candidatus Sulfotelmatobacter sp.]|nr:hypothetical protein [Candidatus Sulfotelmatobacter sp.]